MKKALLYLCLAVGLMSCAKEIEISPVEEETPAGVPMTFKLTVSDTPETRVAKTAWAEGDVIYVFFKGLGEKYVKLTYNGSSWDNASGGGTLLDTDFSGLSDRKLTAVHYPVPVKVTYIDYEDEADKDSNHFFIDNSDWPVIMNYYMSDTGKAYSVDGTTVTATLSLAKPADVALFHIAGLTEGVKDYYLSCPLVKPFACVGVRIDGTVLEETYSEGGNMWGFADADGAVFAGRLMTTEEADYTFTLDGTEGTYTLSRSNRALTAGKMYNFPALDDDDWTLASNIDFVDLGLSSGALWATVNIGARTPEEYGDYFSWGETATKTAFNLANYSYYDYDNRIYTKYSGSDYSILLAEDDAASYNWGGDCRIPSPEDWEELKNNCTWTQTRQDGVEGWQITGNGNSIFLPLGGRYDGSTVVQPTQGFYWSSSLVDNSVASATIMNLTQDIQRMSDLIRYNGAPVRPVKGGNKPRPTYNGHEYVDLGLASGTLWATMNIGASTAYEDGDYFAWGETSAKGSYWWSTYTHADCSEDMSMSTSDITKYTGSDYSILQAEDDAARVNWGGDWRMPTAEEWTELKQSCSYVLITQGEKKVWKITGNNGEILYLPGGGRYFHSDILDFSSQGQGFYWSSSLLGSDILSATVMNPTEAELRMYDLARYMGAQVRPVRKED